MGGGGRRRSSRGPHRSGHERGRGRILADVRVCRGLAVSREIAKLRAARLRVGAGGGGLRPGESRTVRARVCTCAPPVSTRACTIRTPTCCAPLRRRSPLRSAAATGSRSRRSGSTSTWPSTCNASCKEESLIDAVADPAGGSYFVEALTDALARAGWAAIPAGGGRRRICRSARRHHPRPPRRIARGTGGGGVVAAPDARRREQLPGPVPEGACEHAPARRRGRRLAAGRAARGDSQSHPAVRPSDRAFSARAAPDAGRRARCSAARANFCLNLFGCGGFDIEAVGQSYADHGADLIVLCSSDPEYLPLAQEVCAAVRVPVLVAGNPKDQADALTAAGVKGFVHARQRHRADAHLLAGCPRDG